ncbi:MULTISPECIES: hypothetical protein [Desulfitobacterium]|uniref:Uncharacterized protein n=1 Tax=Desulfitobacterium chlororespirans DSM 11544 TaxID=1121395 RepID=A0A1M7UU03_9FIRM|nr:MULTISPECIES: hypothetical protein [Desulfitobacterium]SHN86473.1 hypothetical protein SAMN02745215_04641 [Desulfitobacterium chlororespirans DSM 11544]
MFVDLEQVNREYSFKKSTSERYDIRWGKYGWAVITIDENGGMFNAQSDYGNYAYSWPNHGRKSFKHFISLDLAKDPTYFLGKVSRETHFDYERTIKKWKREIIQIRRNKECTKEQAGEAWDFITYLDDYSGSSHAIQMKVYESHELSAICEEPNYVFGVELDYPPDAKNFAKEVLPIFAEIIRQEIGIKNEM